MAKGREEFNLTKDDAFIAAIFNDGEEHFNLALNNIGPIQVMNMIGHLAILLETREGISVEQTAKHLVDSQGGFEQTQQIKPYGE